MSPSLLIRKAERSDIPGVLRLYGQPDIDNGRILSVTEAEKIFDKISTYPDYCLFVAERDEIIVGSFALLIMDNLGHLGAPSAIVEDVVVSPTLHRMGIGRQMMKFAFKVAQEAKCYKLTLSANRSRKDAHSFYESLGFYRHGYSFRIDL